MTTSTVSILFKVIPLIDCAKFSDNLLFLLQVRGVIRLGEDWLCVLVDVTDEFVNWFGVNGTWKINSKSKIYSCKKCPTVMKKIHKYLNS